MGKMLLNGVEYVGGRNTGGASALEDLTDVNVSSITDGQILKYDSTTSKWVNDDESGGTVTDVQVNGTTVVDNGVAEITSYKELTRAEYDLLPDTKYSDGIMYCISDGFDNANGFPPLIYSTEEREVGVWIDGKPLYQKTVDFGSLPNNTDKSVDSGLTTVDCIKVLSAIAYAGENGFTVFIPNTELSSNGNINIAVLNDRKIRIRTNYDYSSYSAIVTLHYTKTTDIAGSGRWATDGGLAKHYSTSEQIIGTWIDGKPLYEKVVTKTCSFTTATEANSIYAGNVDLSSEIPNIDMAWIDLNMSWYNPSADTPRGFYTGWYEKDIGTFYIRVLYSRNNVLCTFVIKYTKTTD